MNRTQLTRLAGTLPVILILAACTSSGGATPVPSSPDAVPSAAAPSTAASPAGSASGAAESYPLKVASGTVAGATVSFLTGDDGKTLYVFQKDTADSGKSTCNGTCAGNWPPYAADDLTEVKADSTATGKLSIVTRDDGTKQLAYNGMPLYYFAADKAAGDLNGATLPNWSVAKP